MMDRYIKMRNENVIDVDLFYDYAVSKGFNLGREAFRMGAIHVDVPILIENMDREYGLTILYDKKGIFIKVVQ